MDKLGNQYVSSYRNEGYLPVSKRLTAGFVDAMLLIILSFGLMIASSEIAMAVPSYSEKIETINASRVALYELQEETLLYEYPVDQEGNKDYSTPISQNKVFEKYCYENILYTYSLCKDAWDLAYTLGNDDPTAEAKLASYSPTSYDTDRLAYFYVTYARAHNANGNLFVLQQGETYISHFKTILRNASAGAEWDYFDGDDRLPALSMAFAHRLYRYLVFSEGGQDGLNAYNFLITQYQTLFDDAGQILYQSDAYQALYQTYFSAYGECSRVVSLFSFLSYVASFLLLILLPSLLFKNGETLGLFLRKGTLLHQDRLERPCLVLHVVSDAPSFLLFRRWLQFRVDVSPLFDRRSRRFPFQPHPHQLDFPHRESRDGFDPQGQARLHRTLEQHDSHRPFLLRRSPS